MLTPEYLETVADEVIELYAEFEKSIIRDIAKRLTKANLLVPSVNHQIKVLQESGMLYNDIIKEISKITGKSEEKIRQIFENSAMQSIKLDDEVYRKAGFNPISLNQSDSMLQFLIAGMEKTNKQVNNLTMTLVGNSQAKFTNAVNLAYMQVTSGAFDKNTAILNAIKILSDDGLDVVYPSGKVSKIDVAVRRAVVTGVNQTCGKMQEMRADEFECDLMELTAHPGARVTEKNDYTNHAWWQGKIVSRSGKKGYLSLEDIGYGEITGFLGINCRHGWSPFFEGITKRRYTDKELENINNQTVKYKDNEMGLYEATKTQREKERKIRRLKREVSAYEEILKNSDDEDLKSKTSLNYNSTKNKLNKVQDELIQFTKETGLKRQYERERVINHSSSSKSSFKEDNNFKIKENNVEEYGTSQILNSDVEKICDDVYNQYKKNKCENIALVDIKNNKMLGGIHTDYMKDRVNLSSFQKELSRNYDERSLLLIHNHPNDTTFSIEDIKEFIESKKLYGIVAVGKDYNYFLEIIYEEMIINNQEILNEIYIDIYNIVDGKKENLHFLTNDIVHNIYIKAFNKRGWSYGRKRR